MPTVKVYDQNAKRINGEPPIIGSFSLVSEGINHIRQLHPSSKIIQQNPPYGPGKLVWVDGNYMYFVG